MEVLLHRWLPWAAVGGLVLAGAALPTREAIHDHLFSRVEPEPVQGPTTVDARVVKDSLRSAVREVSQAISVLDGNLRTQRAIADIVARKDRDYVLEVWVVDPAGTIVISGRNRPIWPKVDALAPPSLFRLLDDIPAELLPSSERTVLMTAGAILRGYEFSRQILAKWRDFDFEHQVPSEDLVRRLVKPRHMALGSHWSDRLLVLHPIPGGLIAAVGDNARNLPPLLFRPPAKHPYLLFSALVPFCAGVATYWFSLPAWVAMDAQRRQEKAVAWGLFVLLGNVVALVLYLLVHREV
jgi:hypothetical protein